MRRITRLSALFLTASLAAACGGDDNINDAPDAGNDYVPAYSVSGSVVDFGTGEPVAAAATVQVEGVTPPPHGAGDRRGLHH